MGDWRGPVALVLAVMVGAGWSVALVLAVLDPQDLSHSGRLLLYTLGGALIGGLIAWLGTARRKEEPMSDQDQDVTEPRIRLRLLLQLLRIAAGRRGHAAVVWTGAGFTYHLEVARGGTAAVVVDHDPEADPSIVDRIREALYPAP